MFEHEPNTTPKTLATEKPKTSKFTWKIIGLVIVLALALLYTFFSEEEAQLTPQQLAYQAYVNNFDERLLACNEVFSAEPSEQFNTCLEAANDGLMQAQKRMIWAYARSGEYQNWQAVFNLLRSIRLRDNETQLLLYAILHVMADTDELKEEGELGIKRLVTKNYAPANILLASIYALEQNLLPKTSSASWLLKRSFKQKPEIIDPTKLAIIFAKGWVSSPNIDLGTQVLKESANNGFPQLTNNVAWFLSTIDTNPFTEPEYALDLAKRVIDDPKHTNNPIYVDTLAATYAANNMFEKAISTQENAIELLQNSDFSETVKERELVDYQARLKNYQAKKPLVEESFDKDKEIVFKSLRSDIIDYLFGHFMETIEMPKSLTSAEEE